MNKIETLIKKLFVFTFTMFTLCCVISGCSKSKPEEQVPSHPLEEFFTAKLAENELAFVRTSETSGVLIRYKGKILLFDPGTIVVPAEYELLKKYGVDYLFFTHGHGDHFEENFTTQFFEEVQPHIVAAKHVADILKSKVSSDKLSVVEDGKKLVLADLTVEGIEGIHLGPITLFRVTIDGTTLFHGGDSGYIPLSTMKSDIAFVPTGAPSPTCNPEEAFKMVKDLQPKIVVPFHGREFQNKQLISLVADSFPEIKGVDSEYMGVERLVMK